MTLKRAWQLHRLVNLEILNISLTSVLTAMPTHGSTELFFLIHIAMKLLITLCRPYLTTFPRFLIEMPFELLLNEFLEIQHSTLTLGVQWAVHVDCGVQAFLDTIHEVEVFPLDAFEEISGPLKDIFTSCGIAECLVLRRNGGGASWYNSHNEEIWG